MSEDSPAGCWNCIITGHFEVGEGRTKYTQFRAQSATLGAAPKEIVFRFSQVDHLAKALTRVPELSDVSMPRMPPKVTFRTLTKGRFDAEFLDQRQALIQ
mmetsp:Transcript_43797/g.70099  ORF Transcript_43797/g.70099 Transcript_43797/m.70099 type:complete len:100 (-) Transcript_43797:14-313(-)